MTEQEFYKRLKGVADEAAYETTSAYSFDAFGMTEWRKCAEYLESELNLGKSDIKKVLCSKHMRWARDKSDEPYDECTVQTLQDYHERSPYTIRDSVGRWTGK